MSDQLPTESQQGGTDLDVNVIIETDIAMSDHLPIEPEKAAEPEHPPPLPRSASFAADWRRRWRKLNSQQRGWLLLSIAAVCAGFIFSWLIKADSEKRLAIQEWPIVTGVVIGKDTLTHQESSEYGPDRYHYHAVLVVEYLVDDGRHSVRLEDNARQYGTAGGALAAHPVGEDQRLYVNPANPAEAVLYFEKFPPADDWIGTSQIVMIFCAFVAVMLLLLARSSGSR
jgi:hypothetical protein